MAVIVLTLISITIGILYFTVLNGQKENLRYIVTSQARLIESVSRFDQSHNQNYVGGPVEATFTKIMDAHFHYVGFGKTGEFTVAKRQGDNIVYILGHRNDDIYQLTPVPFNAKSAEASRLALSGQSGTLIGADYRGVLVLAAYEPVKGLNWGIVAKIDMSEVRAPFIKAAMISCLLGFFAILVGAIIFVKLTNPLIENLNKTVAGLEEALANVNRLSGLLPICSHCKNIRDDQGYWTQIEAYIKEHSEAEFSHSLCPECYKKYYADINKKKS